MGWIYNHLDVIVGALFSLGVVDTALGAMKKVPYIGVIKRIAMKAYEIYMSKKNGKN